MRRALLFLLAMTGCSAAPAHRSDLFESAWNPPTGLKCQMAASPVELPEADAVVDIAMIRDHVVASRGRDVAVPRTLFTIRFDSTGALHSARVVEPRSESQGLRELTAGAGTAVGTADAVRFRR
jgi:hypothetical protein